MFLFGDGRWYLNLSDYPTIESAIDYLDKRRLTVDEWLTFADARRTAMRERVAEYRNR